MGVVVEQYDVCIINPDPNVGHEIKKVRPCLVISPDEMNKFVQTIIIAPMTTKSHDYPTRVPVDFQGKKGWVVLDQIRTVDRARLIANKGKIKSSEIDKVKALICEMLVD